jgi:hypothetical protein
MRHLSGLFVVTLLLFIAAATTSAQNDDISAAQNAENLRTQLYDVKAKEGDLNGRLHELDEALKPENIERSLAGIGSTRPEELRELRRKQLTNEKNSVLKQLEILANSRARLETAIVTADNQAYQQSAQGTPLNRFGMANYMTSPRLMVGGLLILVIAGIVGVIAVVRRL